MQLMETLQHELPTIETQIPPIHEQFAILEKYEVPVQDDVSSSGPSQPQALGCQEGEQRSEWGRRRKAPETLRAKVNSCAFSGQLEDFCQAQQLLDLFGPCCPRAWNLATDSGLEDWKRVLLGVGGTGRALWATLLFVMSPGAGNAGQSQWGMGCLPANTAGQ